MPVKQSPLFEFRRETPFPPGFRFHEDAVTPEQEAAIVERISVLPFRQFQFRGFEGKRRVASFGWRYDFNEHRLSKAERIPVFLIDIYDKIHSASGFTLSGLQ